MTEIDRTSGYLVVTARAEADRAIAQGYHYGHPSTLVGHVRDLCNEVERLQQCVANLNERIKQIQIDHGKELRESVRDAHAELGWQQRQGDEYGSY